MAFPTKRTPDQRDYVAFTVTTEADGLSDVADFGGLTPRAIETSTTWTAAGLDFLGSQRSSDDVLQVLQSSDGGIFRVSSGTMPTAVANLFSLESNRLEGFRFLQLRSASTGSTAIVQQAARTVYVYLGVPQGPIK